LGETPEKKEEKPPVVRKKKDLSENVNYVWKFPKECAILYK
jgi:hypothetical protein